MSTNSWFIRITNTQKQQFVILSNGKTFKVGGSTMFLPRRLVNELKQLYQRYYNWFKQEHDYIFYHEFRWVPSDEQEKWLYRKFFLIKIGL